LEFKIICGQPIPHPRDLFFFLLRVRRLRLPHPFSPSVSFFRSLVVLLRWFFSFSLGSVSPCHFCGFFNVQGFRVFFTKAFYASLIIGVPGGSFLLHTGFIRAVPRAHSWVGLPFSVFFFPAAAFSLALIEKGLPLVSSFIFLIFGCPRGGRGCKS